MCILELDLHGTFNQMYTMFNARRIYRWTTSGWLNEQNSNIFFSLFIHKRVLFLFLSFVCSLFVWFVCLWFLIHLILFFLHIFELIFCEIEIRNFPSKQIFCTLLRWHKKKHSIAFEKRNKITSGEKGRCIFCCCCYKQLRILHFQRNITPKLLEFFFYVSTFWIPFKMKSWLRNYSVILMWSETENSINFFIFFFT